MPFVGAPGVNRARAVEPGRHIVGHFVENELGLMRLAHRREVQGSEEARRS
jgi:hypothetical protein